MRLLALVVVCSGCASTPPAPGPRASVDVPAWAEGPGRTTDETLPAPVPTTVTLGTNAHPHERAGKRIDLDLVNADLPNVCRLIGELAGVNVVVADGVTGTVTVKLKNVSWEDALDAILLSKGYVKERVGDVIVVRR